MSTQTFYGTVRAPEFPSGAVWVNTPRPLRLADLRGKLVLLDFWTYGCINCIHIIPDLKRLEALYPQELVVIGVHSAKFANEREAANLERIVRRYEIEHPVVSDPDYSIWQSYAVRAWPTTVLIDPRGRVIGSHSGEGVLQVFEGFIAQAIRQYDEDGVLDRSPLPLAAAAPPPATPLLFPGKVLADELSGRLFISDTNHHRIVVTDLGGAVLDVIGSGAEALQDGDFTRAAFARPQGLALVGTTLYIADTENHAIRAADLGARTVRTVAGDGTIGYGALASDALNAQLNSPWDVAWVGGRLYIAMAGLHQIWVLDPATGRVEPYAGTRAEALLDGPRGRAALAQPSGLATDGEVLYFADSEASAIRYVELGSYARVQTLVGEGLFEFGDVDGARPTARLQHPLGVEWRDGLLYIADTYNHKIKVLDPRTGSVQTFVGSGRPGADDGAGATFYEPGGLSAAGGRLYVADTNNHAVRVIDLETREVTTLALSDPRGLLQQAAPAAEGRGTAVPADEAQHVRAGRGRVVVEVEVPPGFKLTPDAPSTIAWQAAEDGVVRLEAAEAQFDAPGEHAFPAEFVEGEGWLRGNVTLFYCAAGEDAGLCYLDAQRLEIPVRVTAGAGEAEVVARVVLQPQ